MNRLYYGDCLTITRDHVNLGSVDLIDLEPPFNSNQEYNAIYKDETGRPYRKTYLPSGRPATNLWNDIDNLSGRARERIGYATQSPLPCLNTSSRRRATRATRCLIPSVDALRHLKPPTDSIGSGPASTLPFMPSSGWRKCAGKTACAWLRVKTSWLTACRAPWKARVTCGSVIPITSRSGLSKPWRAS